jgi:uncharacterized protein YkwD
MKKLLIIIILFSSFKGDKQISTDKEEAQKAFAFLNEIRNNPDAYSKELQYAKGLKVSKLKLVWNDTLAKVAEAKAYDLAKKNYFAHVNKDGQGINYLIAKSGYALNSDWTKKKSDNFFESLSANNPTGVEAIKALIIDKGNPQFGHRKHLLGLDEWNATLKDIGIGFVRSASGSAYQTYMCVIIAKHNW